MYHPAPTELLNRLQAALATEVYPTVSDDNARRQLKAALRVLQRLSTSWLSPGRWLDDDAANYREALGRLADCLRERARDDDGLLEDVTAEASGSGSLAGLQESTVEFERRLRHCETFSEDDRRASLKILHDLHYDTVARAVVAMGLEG